MKTVKLGLLLFCWVLPCGSLHGEVTTKRIEGLLYSTLIYYKDGREVAREITDKEGNIDTIGKVPNEYFTQQPALKRAPGASAPANNTVKSQPAASAKTFTPFDGEVSIAVNQAPRVAWTNKGRFAEFRKGKVEQYSQLNIFPTDYDPFSSPRDSIYKNISFGKHWTDYSQFYVANPYLLIMLSKSQSIRSFEDNCGLASISYDRGVFEETYANAKVAQFFSFAELNDGEIQRAVMIWMVNAQDAGFRYISVDKTKCQNIDFAWNSAPDNIANSVYSSYTYYHGFEGDQLNDISPIDNRASLMIKDIYKYTCIYVKLWKNRPANREDTEDLAWVIKVIP